MLYNEILHYAKNVDGYIDPKMERLLFKNWDLSRLTIQEDSHGCIYIEKCGSEQLRKFISKRFWEEGFVLYEDMIDGRVISNKAVELYQEFFDNYEPPADAYDYLRDDYVDKIDRILYNGLEQEAFQLTLIQHCKGKRAQEWRERLQKFIAGSIRDISHLIKCFSPTNAKIGKRAIREHILTGIKVALKYVADNGLEQTVFVQNQIKNNIRPCYSRGKYGGKLQSFRKLLTETHSGEATSRANSTSVKTATGVGASA